MKKAKAIYKDVNNLSVPLVQGGPVVWMQRPSPRTGCPPGLEYLINLDRVFTSQIPCLLEAFTGWDTANKYAISNSTGQQVFYAMEISDACMRYCVGSQRGFTIHIVDNTNQEVFQVTREFKCCAGCGWCAGCCDCCAHEISVQTPSGEILGYVKQKGVFCGVRFEILDLDHKPVLKIESQKCFASRLIMFSLLGPCCRKDIDFKVLTVNGETEIGVLKKHYAGFVQEMVTNADKFSVSFPIDMSVATKATLIGAVFLIDFMLFETNQSRSN